MSQLLIYSMIRTDPTAMFLFDNNDFGRSISLQKYLFKLPCHYLTPCEVNVLSEGKSDTNLGSFTKRKKEKKTLTILQ